MRAQKQACLSKAMNKANAVIGRLFAGLIGVFKLFRPLLGPKCCRFSPTCTEYAARSFVRHGAAKGAALSISRIFRCHPWNHGGFDPVP